MGWQTLSTIEQVDALKSKSSTRPQIIFKHSTRCATSDMAKSRMDRAMQGLEAVADLHFLDLLSFRAVSNYIADSLHEPHESPQMLLLVNGEVVLEQSHISINPHEILDTLKQLA